MSSSIRPTGYPEWASSATNITEPLDSKKSIGWATNEAPASAYVNWLDEKTTAWIRYLSYEPVVYDDFVYPTGMGNPPSGFDATMLSQFWDVKNEVHVEAANNGDGVGVLGLYRKADFKASGLYAVTKNIGPFINATTDVLVEGRVQIGARNPNHVIQFGVLNSDASGTNKHCMAFQTTGPSGSWFFMYGATSATMVDLNFRSDGGVIGRYADYFVAERRGPTLTVQINGTTKATVASPTGLLLGDDTLLKGLLFGARAYGTSGTAIVTFDSLKLGVRR